MTPLSHGFLGLVTAPSSQPFGWSGEGGWQGDGFPLLLIDATGTFPVDLIPPVHFY